MRLALTDLDSGQFFSQDGWTSDYRLAKTFSTQDEVSQKATEQKVKNAAAAMLGSPQKPIGFTWLTEAS